MAKVRVRGVHLYYEEHGHGPAILLIHGVSSSAMIWGEAIHKLSQLGRVIAYDRRGCTRSERPEPYETTTIAEQADDAAELLVALGANPALVMGRSYGGGVALDLALRYPAQVRALVLLEGAPPNLSPPADAWLRGVVERIFAVADESGVDAVGEALMREVTGQWEALPEALRDMVSSNGPAILAEFRGEFRQEGFRPDPASLSAIEVPTLAVSAADSPEAFRKADEVLAASLPNARTALVAGSHLISPDDPAILDFVRGTLREASGRA